MLYAITRKKYEHNGDIIGGILCSIFHLWVFNVKPKVSLVPIVED